MYYRRSIYVAIIASAAVAVSSVCAQPITASESATTLPGIKNGIVKATGAQAETIELSTTATTFIVKVVNGKFADATTTGRENEASAIEAVVVNAIKEKELFKNIVVIVVQYLKRRNSSSRTVDHIEFRKDTAGVFRHHAT
jgi:hypothetical protein